MILGKIALNIQGKDVVSDIQQPQLSGWNFSNVVSDIVSAFFIQLEG
jgi:hypothetical protein